MNLLKKFDVLGYSVGSIIDLPHSTLRTSSYLERSLKVQPLLNTRTVLQMSMWTTWTWSFRKKWPGLPSVVHRQSSVHIIVNINYNNINITTSIASPSSIISTTSTSSTSSLKHRTSPSSIAHSDPVCSIQKLHSLLKVFKHHLYEEEKLSSTFNKAK